MASALSAALASSLEDLAGRDLEPLDVAILDSGIDATHPDLAGRISAAYQVEVVDDQARVVASSLQDNNDVFGHGTAVASIVAGIAPNARLVDIRVLGPDNSGSGLALIAGLQWANELRCRVINMSLAASAKYSAQLHALCESAYRRGQIVVAAKRNMPLVDNGFPAEFTSVISVDRLDLGRLTEVHYLADSIIEFAAPGTNLTVAAPGGGHTVKTGTSFATPAVSGVCALLLGGYPDLRMFELKSLLKAMAP